MANDTSSAPPNPAAPPRKRIGELLVEAGLVNVEQVVMALGMLDAEQLNGALARQLGIATADLETLAPEENVLNLLPEDFLRGRKVIPLAVQNRALVLGMVDAQDQKTLAEVVRATGHRNIEPRMITEGSFDRFVAGRFTTPEVIEALRAALGPGGALTFERGGSPDAAPIVAFVEWLLRYAVSQGASDIHIEPYEAYIRIRLRVDGALRAILTPPASLGSAVVSRIKVMAEMDISERRKPLDGHIELPSAEEELHFRVSTLPVVHGEKCVIRLLRKEGHLADLARLGFAKDQYKLICDAGALPQGLILVTGPTGSGKTTTLHAVLNHINDPDTNIVTIEDPVEQTLPGINHVQVQEKGGVTFSSALRAILRQDPDIVFVGEMRDPEVAAIAVKAALTGHLVLSTLHTNGTAETFARLADMGLASYLVTSSVQLVVAQRLVRRVCGCAVSAPIDAALMDRYGITETQLATAVLKQPVGCAKCHGTGYKGRVPVYEMVAPSAALREVLRSGGGESEIVACMNAEGVKWMWDSGVARALAGETTLEEVAKTINPPAR